MKRLAGVFLAIIILISMCGCAKTKVMQKNNATLTFISETKNIQVELETDEAEKIAEILNGNIYEPNFAGEPSCSFDKNVSISIDNQVFAIAQDTCNYLQDLQNLKYFSISQEDMKYIHSIFEKHGGCFPCV